MKPSSSQAQEVNNPRCSPTVGLWSRLYIVFETRVLSGVVMAGWLPVPLTKTEWGINDRTNIKP